MPLFWSKYHNCQNCANDFKNIECKRRRVNYWDFRHSNKDTQTSYKQ